jgi:two-component system, LytTR family, response regulator
MTMKAILIDDEARARSLLAKMLKEYCPEVEVADDCGDLPSGVKAIRKLKPDVVFLDIEMPGYSGLEILDFFDEQEIGFEIIFVTAYNNYAVKAFKLSAVDYLLKPVDPADLEQAVARLKKRTQREAGSNLALLKEHLKEGGLDRIAVPDANSVKFLKLDEILFFKADNTYTDISFVDGSKLTISRTLKNIGDTLSSTPAFYRCHKSYIINMKFLTDYVKSDGGYLVIQGKYNVPVSPDRVQDLLNQAAFVRR